MCLAIPSKIIKLHPDNIATVDTMGAQRKISLDLMDESVEIGDFILIHVGYAISKLNEEEARETLKLYDEIVRAME